MDLRQFWFDGLAQASYMLVDGTDAIVVDPALEIEQYVDAASEHGARIRHIVETHVHADFVSGHVELSEATGAPVWFGARVDTDFAASPLEDGAELSFGASVLRALETPGHTPESLTLVARGRDGRSVALTGDTLFVGDVGRPDLAAGARYSVTDMARMLYASLTEKVMRLPDDTLVYPAHGAGSLCGKSLSGARSTTVRNERLTNPALAAAGEDAFVRYVTSDLPPQPAYFARAARVNRSGPMRRRVFLESMRPLTPADVAREVDAGAIVLDTRDEDVFPHGHIPAAVNVALCDKLGAWAGTVLPADARLVLCADPGTERVAALELLRVGADPPVGYLSGGMAAWRAAGQPEESIPEIAPEALLAERARHTVIDVRAVSEFETDHVKGAINVPLTELPRRLAEFTAATPYALICASGFRSMIAASVLKRAGVRSVANVLGGMGQLLERTERRLLA